MSSYVIVLRTNYQQITSLIISKDDRSSIDTSHVLIYIKIIQYMYSLILFLTKHSIKFYFLSQMYILIIICINCIYYPLCLFRKNNERVPMSYLAGIIARCTPPSKKDINMRLKNVSSQLTNITYSNLRIKLLCTRGV